MSKQKTAMQQLIKFIEYYYGNCTLIGDKAKSLLKPEKEQIEQSFDAGIENYNNCKIFDGEQYFIQTFENSVVS